MEYMVFLIMIVFIILFVMLIVFGSQFISAGSEYARGMEQKSLFITQNVISSPVMGSLSYQSSVFDDSKLSVMTCDDVNDLFGAGIYMEIRIVQDIESLSACDEYRPGTQIFDICERREKEKFNATCTEGENHEEYPDCYIWRFCEEEKPDTFRTIPVNVYRKIDGSMKLAVLKIGVS